jgi:HlyD family secretion protein
MSARQLRSLAATLVLTCALTACKPAQSGRLQGYVEGEFVYVASPGAGALEKLGVQRGGQVKTGDLLFALDSRPERAAHDEAARRLAQAKANLEDTKKGRRPEEIAAMEAQIDQSRAALALSTKEKARQEELLKRGVASRQDLDRAVSTYEQDRKKVAQLEADLETARLGSRSDQVAAAEADMRAREAALAKADWDLAQKEQSAPQAGLIFDTLYREGEWVGAGRPVVVLLPPANIKVRAFVAESRVGSIRPGNPIRAFLDGLGEPVTGKISFVSPQAEYTPPVIYSRETRGKLVFMIEAVFDPATAAKLNPGQPVEVEIGKSN